MDINHKEWQKIIPLENCLIGTLLKDPSGDKFINIYDKIFVGDFYDQTNANIFKLLEDLIVSKSSRVDVAILIAATDISVTGKKIRELYKEERAIVSELYNAVDSIVNASKLRQLTVLSNETTNNIQSANDAEQVIEQCEKALFSISERREDSYVTPADLIDNSVELIMHNTDLDGITGIPTGIAQLDKLTCGLQRGNLIIVAGRPSVGKSLLALQLMIDNALSEKTVGYFNLDMTTHMVMERTIAYIAEVPLHKIRSRNLSLEEREAIKKAIPKIKGMNLLIDSCSSLTPHQLLSKVRRMKMRNKTLDLICIDFVQCLSTKDSTFKSRNAEIEYIADSIREVAREFNVPVIAVSQLSRGVDSREDKRPILSDLRDSGSLEQNADLVIFVYRDSYYSKDTSDKSAELILAKQRNGPVGTVPITIEFDRQKIL